MARNIDKRVGVWVMSIAIVVTLSGCGTLAPSRNVPTTVPTNTGLPATPTVLVPPLTITVAPVTPSPDSGPATPTGTLLSSPVTGSVLVEGGSSVAGGLSGDTIELHVAFTANSTAGPVKEMRVEAGSIGCARDDNEMSAYQWEPLAPEKVYTTTAFINFQGWYVNVQYRDVQGNVSPVYCDDISIEGMPPRPTP